MREARHQEPGLALHGRIGRRKIRQIGHRNAEEFQLRVLEVQHLLGLVVNDARALDLPQRRLLRIVLAGCAGGIDAVLEDGVVAAGAVRAGRRHARRVGGVDAQRIDETVAVVVAQIHDVGVGDLAFRIGHADVALGVKPLGLLVVDDLVGLDAGAVVEHLHVADRRHPLNCCSRNRPRPPGRASARHWRDGGGTGSGRPRIVGKALRGRRRGAGNAERGGQNQPENQRPEPVR